MAEPPVQPGFRGANPVAYRIDADGTLRKGSDPLSSGTVAASSPTPLLQVSPQWFNAPSFFRGQSKPSAFCSLAVSQRKPLSPMVNQLSWGITYSLLTAANQDIGSQSFTLAQQDADKFSNIPLPAGRGQLQCSVYAYVGGDPGKTFQIISNTLKQLGGIVGSASSQAFLSIPAADATALSQVQALFQQIIQEFAPPQWSQYWLNTNQIALAVTQDAAMANPAALRLGYGFNTIVIIPAQSNPGDQPGTPPPYFQTVNSFVGKAQFAFALDPDGVTMTGGTNPFLNIPYVALTIEVDNGGS
jgi:hypothetical protein